MIGDADMSDPANVVGQGTPAPALASKYELEIRSKFGGSEKEILHTLLAVGQAVSHKRQLANQSRVWLHGIVAFRIEAVVDGHTIPRPESQIMFHHRRPAAVGEDEVVLRNQSPKGIFWIVLDPR